MSKAAKDSKQNQPNLVAKLMGLEALTRKYYSSQHSQMEDSFVDKEMLHEDFVHNKTWMQQSQRTSHDEDFVDDVEKMALIQQKFMEAKFMSTDERMRNSKQFKDALEVLSSNSDLLIRLLDSQNIYQLHSTTTTPPAETKKRITLLKPFAVDNDKSSGKGKRKKKNDELIKKRENADQADFWGNKINLLHSAGNQKVDDVPVQSTRIVVLKPTSGKTHEDDDVAESKKVAKLITQQVHESLCLASVISNCYSGDESSFSKSCHHRYKDGKNFTDFEIMSPTTRRHSFDHNHINDHFGSSSLYYSALSLGGATCSPESSVSIEAKRRLHERWSAMKSNSNNHLQEEQIHHVRRKSTTLGEMLSLFKIKKSVSLSEAEISTNEDDQEEPRNSVSLSHSFKHEMGINDFHENLPPMSNNETEDDDDGCKSYGSKVLMTKSKSMRSLFRGKVSNFLFARKKNKSTKLKDESQCSVTETTSHSSVNSERVLKDDDLSQSFNRESSVPALCESLCKTSSDSVIITIEPGLIVSKAESSSENQDQPSPISVLDTPFEDDSHETLDCMQSDHHGSLVQLKSNNLIDKSPPIESIPRTLSWGGSCADASNSLDTKSEQQEWLILVEKLLSASGFHDDDQLIVHYDSFNTRWHSLESPLDPSLRDKYGNLSENDDDHHLSESKRRKMRSNQKLVFDCINSALLDCGSPEKCLTTKVKSGGGHIMLPQFQEGSARTRTPCHHLFLDHIVGKIMKELIGVNVMRCASGGDDCGDSNSLAVENFVRKEVVGIRWAELMELEVDILGREIESDLLQDLVEDAVLDFTAGS